MANNYNIKSFLDKPYIVGVAGAYKGARFDFPEGSRIVFGRDESTCHVVFDQFQTAVSHQHCTVTYMKNLDMYSIRDISKNGTYINSMENRIPSNVEQMQPRGTIIYIGSARNAFQLM